MWQLVLVQESTNTITTGCFKLTMEGQNDINLKKAHPVDLGSIERYLMSETPYNFTITNVCDRAATVSVNLESLNVDGKRLSDEYVDVVLYDGDLKYQSNIKDYSGSHVYDGDGIQGKIQNLTTKPINSQKVIKNSLNSYQLYAFDLRAGDSRNFNLLLYMDSYTPTTPEVMNAKFNGKITINAIEKTKDIYEHTLKNNTSTSIDLPFNEISQEDHIAGDMYKSIQKIVFQNTLNPIEGEDVIEIDESLSQTNTIKGYITSNEEGLTTLYIQSDGKIYLPTDSSYLFSDFSSLESIEGLEYVDTSNVTDMHGMFTWCWNLENIDLSSFDTSRVTNMQSMFDGCTSLTNLDLSNFDTRKVTNMSSMFYKCSRLTSLNLSNFNTSNVISMSSMFEYCGRLTTTITIMKDSSYHSMFSNAAVNNSAQITVNYTSETSDLVDKMIQTKSSDSNVIKGSLVA